MDISTLFKQGKPVISFEIFPPKDSACISNINDIIKSLKALRPAFISVTYGAGGSACGRSTFEIARDIKKLYGIEPLVHLACISCSKQETELILNKLKSYDINNILALRGDINPNVQAKREFKYAADLISFIKSRWDFGISAACYPEGHVEALSLEKDIYHLKQKVDAGAKHLITQMFFDNGMFYNFLDMVGKYNIEVPIQAGIMPLTNVKQITRMISICGASMPAKLKALICRYEHSKEDLYKAGINYAIEQIAELLSNKIDGIHIYTMNNPETAGRICSGITASV